MDDHQTRGTVAAANMRHPMCASARRRVNEEWSYGVLESEADDSAEATPRRRRPPLLPRGGSQAAVGFGPNHDLVAPSDVSVDKCHEFRRTFLPILETETAGPMVKRRRSGGAPR